MCPPQWGYERCRRGECIGHVKRSAAHGVGLEHARTEVMNEPERGHDERRRAGELLPSIGSRIVPVEREKGEGEKKTRRE